MADPTPRAQDSKRAPGRPSASDVHAYPAPATYAPCPACHAPVEGILGTYPPAVQMATFMVRCPRCAATWTELRSPERGAVASGPRWYSAEGNFLPPREEARCRRRAAALRREGRS